MSWSYDINDLVTTTASGRLNVVRYLVGDNDTNDQQVQDEEITFALGQTGDNVYYAASYVCTGLASKFARQVDTEIDQAIQVRYSQRSQHYKSLSKELDSQGKRFGTNTLGLAFGGTNISDINTVRANTDRVPPAFRKDMFKNPGDTDYPGDYVKE